MAQDLAEPNVWELKKSTHEVLPLVVKNNTTPTTDYVVACLPVGSSADPTFGAPSTQNGATGYMVDGATLGRGSFEILTKINAGAEQPVRIAGILKIV